MVIAPERLAELRASTPHATISDIGEVGAKATPEQIEDLTAYLHFYAPPKPVKDGWLEPGPPCLVCDQVGSFVWGIQHGEGHCINCRWPGTLYHFVKDRNGSELVTIRGLLLQYHPEFISVKNAEPVA